MTNYPVSVVIPTYNSARFIAETLNSVVTQTLPPAEIILADGGSTDATFDIASKFDVKISTERSHNIPSGKNIGMRAAGSEWVAFVDHDDVWEPTKLEQQVNAVRTFPDAKMVLTDYAVFIDGEDTLLPSDAHAAYRRAIDKQGGNYFPSIDFTNREWIIPLTSSALIRNGTEWFDEDLQGTDDIEFFLRLMTQPFVLLDSPLVRWRKSRESYSQHDPILMELDFIKVMDKILASPERYPPGIPECIRGIRHQRLRQTSLKLLKRGRALESFSMLRESYSRTPGSATRFSWRSSGRSGPPTAEG